MNQDCIQRRYYNRTVKATMYLHVRGERYLARSLSRENLTDCMLLDKIKYSALYHLPGGTESWPESSKRQAFHRIPGST